MNKYAIFIYRKAEIFSRGLLLSSVCPYCLDYSANLEFLQNKILVKVCNTCDTANKLFPCKLEESTKAGFIKWLEFYKYTSFTMLPREDKGFYRLTYMPSIWDYIT